MQINQIVRQLTMENRTHILYNCTFIKKMKAKNKNTLGLHNDKIQTII